MLDHWQVITNLQWSAITAATNWKQEQEHGSFLLLLPSLMMDWPGPTIEVASRYEAGDVLCSPERCAEVTYLVSIGDVQDELPLGYHNVNRKLRLLVADVVTEIGATEQDIQQIITLARELHSVTGRILIHCEAGVSRSSAAALIMYACWLGPGQEREAMMRVLVQRPIAIPNRRMVALADRLLEREGRLVAAARESVYGLRGFDDTGTLLDSIP